MTHMYNKLQIVYNKQVKEIIRNTKMKETEDLAKIKKDDKTYRIVSNIYWKDGLFAVYKHVASRIIKAYEDGEIPVVDLKHYKNILFKDGREYFDNAWEYFFKQPAGIGIDELDGKNVIIDPTLRTSWPNKAYEIIPQLWLPRDKNDRRKHPYAERYAELLQFNDKMKQYFKTAKEKYFGDEKEILGIIMRGSDYVMCRPCTHSIPPDIEEVIKKAKELQSELHYKKIYLATEDKKYYDRFKQEFGEMLIENAQYKYQRTDITDYIASVKIGTRKNHLYNLQKEYACSIYLVSQCKYLIGSICNATFGAYFMSNCFDNYDYVYLWDKGVYLPIPNYNNILERIFSVKNIISSNKKHKCLTIFGIRIKFKKHMQHQ